MQIVRSMVPTSASGFFIILVAAAFVASLICMVALSMGSTNIPILDLIKILLNNDGSLASRIILEIRLPRVLTGFCVGGMLALAGCLMQVLLRNPLAEPYILGISGGAAVFSLSAILIGVSGYWVNLGAFTGAIISILLVFLLSRAGGEWNSLRTLLTGVVLAAGWGAIISFLLAISPSDRLHGMLFWLMGDLSFAEYSSWNFIVLIVSLAACMFIARALNLLAMGKMNALALGVSVTPLNYFIFFLASILTAAAVMQAGSIGFVGLVIPHLVRLLFGSDHRLLLPVSVIFGGSLLVFADGLARTVMAPQQLPVGVLTAMMGVPLFLLLLRTSYVKKS
ncbi:MAG: iron complex transport system permease protein [Gammaproteobacteria bacterium]|jgi:iron complex transport system permease protein